jgi:hypothetical protein
VKTTEEKFDAHRFADYNNEMIDPLARVTSVNIRTVAIM